MSRLYRVVALPKPKAALARYFVDGNFGSQLRSRTNP